MLNSKKSLLIQGLYGKIKINLDSYGIPHIFTSKNDIDAFYGLGYMHAKDRFWQMELQRHIASGTLSEIFGKRTIKEDKYLKTWGFYRCAKENWKHFNIKTKKIINGYTAGVNAYIKSGKRPIELRILFYKPKYWKNIDSFIWSKIIAWQLQYHTWQDKLNNSLIMEKSSDINIEDIRIQYPENAPTTLNIEELNKSNLLDYTQKSSDNLNTNKKNQVLYNNNMQSFINISQEIQNNLNIQNLPGKGSNGWVISGKLTKSGKPILANDIHLELSSPNICYLANMQGPSLNIRGSSIPGIPCIISGENKNIAWGITDAGLDCSDLFLIDKTRPTKKIFEKIKVRKKKTIQHEIELSDIGPIINNLIQENDQINKKIINQKIAIRWTGLDSDDKTIQSLIETNYASNWKEFKNALKDFTAAPMNFLYADILGNIGYYLPGRIPIRKKENLKYVIPFNSKNAWNEFIPFNKLPHVFNPSKGYIVNANNKIIPNEYPYNLTYIWKGPPYRAEKIEYMINNMNKMTIKNMKDIQINTNNLLWYELKDFLLKIIPQNKFEKKILIYLKKWNGNMSSNSISATVFSFWFQEIIKIQPKLPINYQNFPNPLFIIDQLKKNGKFICLNKKKNITDVLYILFKKAIVNIKNILGNNIEKWKWGKIHQAKFINPIFGKIWGIKYLWNRKISTEGNAYTINASPYDENFIQKAGPVYRQIIDLNKKNKSYFICPLGQSGNPFSKNYDNMLKFWKLGKYIKL